MRLIATLLCPSLLLFVGLAQDSTASALLSEDFSTGDGGFTVVDNGAVENPWTYLSDSATWATDGTENVGAPTSSALTSPVINVTADGSVTLSFDHRYSFEYDGTTRWDGGNVQTSVNGGAFSPVLGTAFTANGYDGVITGNNAVNGQEGFNDVSPGFATPAFITSTANLGEFSAGDTLQVQFLGGWDEFTKAGVPNWEIDQVVVVPEPGAWLLLILAVSGLLAARRR